jgi:hypothetical protein
MRPTEQSVSPDDRAWRETKSDDLAGQLRRTDPRDEWKNRAIEIFDRVLAGISDDVARDIITPHGRELGAHLRQCWNSGSWQDADFWLNSYELALKFEVEQLARAATEQQSNEE